MDRKTLIILIIITALISVYLMFKDSINRMIKKNILNTNTDIPENELLLFEQMVKVNHDEFIQEVKNIGIDLDVNPNALMYWMGFESAYSFSPSITNSLGYVGLIQFGKAAASDLGTTQEALKVMTNVEQLVYVKKYLQLRIKQKGKLKNWLDVYLSIFYPAAIGKPDTYTLPKNVTPANPQFDYVIKDGIISVGEIRKYFQDRIKFKTPTVPQIYWKYFNI